MKLLTKDIEEKLKEYPLGSQDGKLGNSKVIAKFFNLTGVWTWYIIEGKLLENGDAEMFGYYYLGDDELAEFQKEEYASMWSAVIYGSSVGSNDIVKVALEKVGNVGGQPFWSWYGFGSRVEWCACFVSTEILYFSIGKVMALQITLE